MARSGLQWKRARLGESDPKKQKRESLVRHHRSKSKELERREVDHESQVYVGAMNTSNTFTD